MKKIVLNKDNINIDKVEETVIRVKGLLLNEQNELLLVHNNHTYQFPGGHWNNKESLEQTLLREIKEEAGITVEINTGPFMVIEEYYDNYLLTGKTRCNKIYYYAISSNEKPNIKKMSLSELEKQTDFHLFYVKIENMEVFLEESIKNKQLNDIIGYEMIEAIKEYKYRFIVGRK